MLLLATICCDLLLVSQPGKGNLAAQNGLPVSSNKQWIQHQENFRAITCISIFAKASNKEGFCLSAYKSEIEGISEELHISARCP